MKAWLPGGLGRGGEARELRQWSRAATEAAEMDLSDLRTLRDRAGALRARLDRLIHVADSRLALPRIGAAAVPKPLHCDWAWRPPLWQGRVCPPGRASIQNGARIGDEAALFHDCAISELTFRQIRNTGPEDLAPFGVRFDVFAFDGSFLSLVIDLSEEGVRGLGRNHLVRLTIAVELEKPLEIFGRLNVRHGPNTEQIVREFPMDAPEMTVEFDLAYTELNEKLVERAWLDLIFEGPEMNQILLRDVTLARRPRAAL